MLGSITKKSTLLEIKIVQSASKLLPIILVYLNVTYVATEYRINSRFVAHIKVFFNQNIRKYAWVIFFFLQTSLELNFDEWQNSYLETFFNQKINYEIVRFDIRHKKNLILEIQSSYALNFPLFSRWAPKIMEINVNRQPYLVLPSAGWHFTFACIRSVVWFLTNVYVTN